ncbi:hypothetical protein FDECE_1693 [Fusarium decemcellulare]|nr:hypothetical protein FDECE_1693 [Fusarium decemcellulare]
MWDSLKTATGPGASVHQLPPPELKKRAFLRTQTGPLPLNKSTSSLNKGRNGSRDNNDDDRAYWQNDFDNRLNGLGIQNGPFKYEIRRGKTVPQPDVSGQRQLSPPLDSDDLRVRAPAHNPPPRNPRRLQPKDEAPWRPTSSVYGEDDDSSRHSRYHDHQQQQHHHHRKTSRSKAPAKDMYGRPSAIEISPPSSPEFDASRNGPHSEDVSPIDESPDASQVDLLRDARSTTSPQHPRSQIPTLRRERTRDQDHRPSRLRESKSIDQLQEEQKHLVKHPWDETSGHHPPPNKPQQGFGLTTTVTGPQTSRSPNPPSSFGQRMRKFARGRPEPVDSRPPWNGASGRAPLVEPVHDDPSVAPLNLQRRVSKRVGLGGGVSSETPNGAATTVRRLLPSRSNQKLKEASKTPSPEPTSQATTSHAYPSPPYSNSPPVASHPARPSHAMPLLSPNRMPDQQKAIKRKPSPSARTSGASFTSSVYSAQTDQTVSVQTPLLDTLEPTSLTTPEDPWVQPPSRFSVTTCNTAAPETPRLSDDEDRPPMPTPPKQLPSVMDRRRPVPGGDGFKRASDETIIISMKAAARSTASSEETVRRSSTERPVSVISTDKALPPAPPELQSANDRVANLTARLDSLAHRRMNINRGIKQMTELMPTDNLMASADVLRKREVEKRKVEGLKEELAEIQREEHDLGLKLYRANKRLEREANFESSSLWVRRVTG